MPRAWYVLQAWEKQCQCWYLLDGVLMAKPLKRPTDSGSRFADVPLPGRHVGREHERVFVPAPPSQKARAPRPVPLRGGHIKGLAARDALQQIIHGDSNDGNDSNDKRWLHGNGRFGRWSRNKTLFTELQAVIEGASISNLVAILSQARTLGANWPEVAAAANKLNRLQTLRQDMETALESSCIDEVEHLLHGALAEGVEPEPTNSMHSSSELSNLVLALERHYTRLCSLRADLKEAAQSADIDWISNTLRVAAELGAEWKEAEVAQAPTQALLVTTERNHRSCS